MIPPRFQRYSAALIRDVDSKRLRHCGWQHYRDPKQAQEITKATRDSHGNPRAHRAVIERGVQCPIVVGSSSCAVFPKAYLEALTATFFRR